MNDEDLFNWLIKINEEFIKNEIHPLERPFEAISKYSREFNVNILMGFGNTEVTQKIFDWFEKNSREGTQKLEPVFTGAFYYDQTFWRLEIPIILGQMAISPFDLLIDMPDIIKEQLKNNEQYHNKLHKYFVNCINYAFGKDNLLADNILSQKSKEFLNNAILHLSGAISLILEKKVNYQSINSLRFAVEIFMKFNLIQKKNLEEKELINLGHNLPKIALECYKATNNDTYKSLSNKLSIFPPVSSRYDGYDSMTDKKLCEITYLTQEIASTIIMEYKPSCIKKF